MAATKNKLQTDETFDKIWKSVSRYTMTSRERGYSLYLAVRYIIDNKIHGSIVECGVWKGGSMMLILKTLTHLNIHGREIFLFDTFEGMTPPGEEDVDLNGVSASQQLEEQKSDKQKSLIWAQAFQEEVEKNIADCGYPASRIHFVRGDVCETLKTIQTGPIALLRLDTDFYDSTKAELEELYPRVNRSGVMIIDDYGHWQGAKKAVDEFFDPASKSDRMKPLLLPVDYTGRFVVKTEDASKPLIDRYDYRPENLECPDLLPYFPSLEERDPKLVRWEYLRYNVPHKWRVDTRHGENTMIGTLSSEEAMLLHALALPFAGKRALEIGCHLAWSSAHILTAGVTLDVVDPALGSQQHFDNVESSLAEVGNSFGVSGAYHLWAGFSPSIISAIASLKKQPWSFVFIDGNHDGDAPADDAKAVINYMADDSLVVFHDLISPHVTAGLEVFHDAGWNTKIYNTMQVLGVAWRGDIAPVEHVADRNVSAFHQRQLLKMA